MGPQGRLPRGVHPHRARGGADRRVRRPLGSLKHKEDIVDGLENAPEAFLGILDGENFGKLLVPVS
jgi:hypothetical protein